MIKEELNKKSPVRLLEEMMGGCVGKGNMGVVSSRKGVGKTAFLVHISTDKLLRGKRVIHISFSSRVDYIIRWYEDIFHEIARKRNLELEREVHDEIVKNRVIMHFNQAGVQIEQVLKSLQAMIECGLTGTDALIIDGYNFATSTPSEIAAFRQFARDMRLEVWFSDSYPIELSSFVDEKGIPLNLRRGIDSLSVIITLKAEPGETTVTLVKSQGEIQKKALMIALDPKTLLIARR